LLPNPANTEHHHAVKTNIKATNYLERI